MDRDPVFLKPRKRYISYSDLWSLARLSGFHVVPLEEADFSADGVYIYAPMFDPELSTRLSAIPVEERKSKLIGWDLERKNKYEADLENLKAVDRVWVSDRTLLKRSSKAMFAILGSHPEFCPPSRGKRTIKYDICHMAGVSERRRIVWDMLTGKGLRVAPAAWGAKRHKILRSSRAMFNVHGDERKTGEPLRFALAAAYGIPMVSETIEDPWPLEPGSHFLMADYQDFGNIFPECLKREDLKNIGNSLKDRLTVEWTFRRGVEDALQRSF